MAYEPSFPRRREPRASDSCSVGAMLRIPACAGMTIHPTPDTRRGFCNKTFFGRDIVACGGHTTLLTSLQRVRPRMAWVGSIAFLNEGSPGHVSGKGQAVSTSSTARRGRFWRTDWVAGLLVVMAVAVPLASRSATAASQPADNGLPVAVPTFALPGYDAAQKEERAARPGAARNNTCEEHAGGPTEAPGRRRPGRPGALTREL